MTKAHLVTWSFDTTHLYLDDELEISENVVVPKGTWCGRKPIKRGRYKMGNGESFDMLTVEFGQANRYRQMWFCKDCQKRAAGYHLDRVADEIGLPSGLDKAKGAS